MEPGALPPRLRAFSLGLLRDRRLAVALAGRGAPLRAGWPAPGDGVAVWGHGAQAWRGAAVAARTGAPLVRIEDAFLRSVLPGRARGAGGALGFLIDPEGAHYDPSAPSLIERLCAAHPLDDHALLARARDGIARLRALDASKYSAHDPDLPPPAPGYVLVIDQTEGDAAVRLGGRPGVAPAAAFREMLAIARIENPGARILIKTHPETALGLRRGHLGAGGQGAEILAAPHGPWALLEGAIAVYTVSSLMGFEAILAGHRPRVFGQPFYAGWGLSADEAPPPRRRRRLTRAQLFAVSHILAPTWVDPCRGRVCRFEEAVDQLEAELRAFREDRRGHVAAGMRAWKRGALRAMFGGVRPLAFAALPAAPARAARAGRDLLVWGAAPVPALPQGVRLRRLEDGFLRSRGLGADLAPPISLLADARGLHYDPSAPSDLEARIAAPCPRWAEARAEALIAKVVAAGATKYNLPGALPDLPEGVRVLVPGQVEDDASIRLGAGAIATNRALLRAARAAHPGAVIVYKPHPDVEAGLRPGAIPRAEALALADAIAEGAPAAALIAACDAVFTMTSTLGFEALLRGKPVTVTGAPFYAGWGLTTDLGAPPARRRARPSLAALAHAALIAAPRYLDPVSGLPCPPEVALERLAQGPLPRRGAGNRLLAKLQGALAPHARLWRR